VEDRSHGVGAFAAECGPEEQEGGGEQAEESLVKVSVLRCGSGVDGGDRVDGGDSTLRGAAEGDA